MSAYNRVLSALREGTGVPSSSDLKEMVSSEETTLENVTRDLDVLLPRLLRLSVSSDDFELRSQIFKIFGTLKTALLQRKNVASEKWWKELEAYMPNDFMTDLKKLMDRDDPAWKESWSLVLFLCFNNPSKKGKCLNSVLKTAEYAFKSKNQIATDMAFECWLELIKMFATNHSIMDIKRIISLLVKPLVSAQLNPTDQLWKVKSWEVIFDHLGPLAVASDSSNTSNETPSCFHNILIPMMNNMFLKGNNSLAALYPMECFNVISNLFEKDFPINEFIPQVINAIPTFLDFNIDHDALLKFLNRIFDSVPSIDENSKAELVTNMTKFSEKALESKFSFTEDTIGKLTFLPNPIVEKISENIVTKLLPVQNKIDENNEISDKSGAAESIVESSPKTTWTNTLASKSIFMHRLAKAESEKKAKTSFSSMHDLISLSPKTSKAQNAISQITPKKSEGEAGVSNLTPKPSNENEPESPQVISKTPLQPKIAELNSNFTSEIEQNALITSSPKLVTPSKIQKISVSPQITPKTPIEKKSPKVQAGVANLTPKSKTPTKCTYFEDDNASDYVVVKPKEKITVLTEHQKEILSKRKSDIPALYQDLSQDTQSIVKEVDHLVTVSEEDQQWLLQDETNESDVKNTVGEEKMVLPEEFSEHQDNTSAEDEIITQPEEENVTKMDVDQIEKDKSLSNGDSAVDKMEENQSVEPEKKDENGISSPNEAEDRPSLTDDESDVKLESEIKADKSAKKNHENDPSELKKPKRITRSSISKIELSKRKSTKQIEDVSKPEESVSEDKEDEKKEKSDEVEEKKPRRITRHSTSASKIPAKIETSKAQKKNKVSKVLEADKRESKENDVNSSTPENESALKKEKKNPKKSKPFKDEISDSEQSQDSQSEEKSKKAGNDNGTHSRSINAPPKLNVEIPNGSEGPESGKKSRGRPRKTLPNAETDKNNKKDDSVLMSDNEKTDGRSRSKRESAPPKAGIESKKKLSEKPGKDESFVDQTDEVSRPKSSPKENEKTTEGSSYLNGKDEKTADSSLFQHISSSSKVGTESNEDEAINSDDLEESAKKAFKDEEDSNEDKKTEKDETRTRRKSAPVKLESSKKFKKSKQNTEDLESPVQKVEERSRLRRKSASVAYSKIVTKKPSSKPKNKEEEKSPDSNKDKIEATKKPPSKPKEEEESPDSNKDKINDESGESNEKNKNEEDSNEASQKIADKRSSCSSVPDTHTPNQAPKEPKAVTEPRKRPKKQPDGLKRVKRLSDLSLQVSPRNVGSVATQDEFISSSESVYDPSMDDIECPEDTDLPNATSEDEVEHSASMDVDAIQTESNDTPSVHSSLKEFSNIESVGQQSDTSQNDGLVEESFNDSMVVENFHDSQPIDMEESVKTPENLRKRKRDETDTPPKEAKRPCLAATPGAKPKKKIKEDITKFFPRIDVPKSFSFGTNVCIKKEKNDHHEEVEAQSFGSDISIKEEKDENEEIKVESLVENKENTEPNGHGSSISLKEEKNEEVEAFIENKENTEPNSHETSAALSDISSKLDPDGIIQVLVKSEPPEESESPTMSAGCSSSYGTPLIFREKRRSIIPLKFGDNWPRGAQENWVASVPSPGITPTKSNLKNFSSFSVQTETPPSQKKRVSFVNPVVTKGLLYDYNSNSGQLRLQDPLTEIPMEADASSSTTDDPMVDSASSITMVDVSAPLSPEVVAPVPGASSTTDEPMVDVSAPLSPEVAPVPDASSTTDEPMVDVSAPLSPEVAPVPDASSTTDEPMVDDLAPLSPEVDAPVPKSPVVQPMSPTVDAPAQLSDATTQTENIPISELLSKEELMVLFNEYLKSCQIQLVMKD